MIYLDNSATTKTYDFVNKVVLETMEKDFGNPSSLHRLGLNAEKIVKNTRKEIAKGWHIKENEVFFTSGGTESNNLALLGMAYANKRRGKHIITTAIEHPSVLETMKYLEEQGFNIDYIPVDNTGKINLEYTSDKVREDTILASVMTVNNEVGTIQDLKKFGDLLKNKNHHILFHTDSVQSFGKINFLNDYVDVATFSSHKIHGPKGIGGIYIKENTKIKSILKGGGQESGFRSGTENVPAIAGLGEAAKYSFDNLEENLVKVSEMRNYLLNGIKDELKDIKVNGFQKDILNGGFASPYVLNISFLGTRSEVILHRLEEDEIYVSVGSACSSNKKGQSHVLKAMGLHHKEIESAIRFSFGMMNEIKEMDIVIDKVKNAVNKFRMLGSFR